MVALTILIGCVAAVLLLSTVSDLLSLVRVGLGARRPPAPRGLTRHQPRLLFLIPAHNEELLIASAITSLKGITYPRDRFHIAVVADNCTDRTAQLSMAADVQCLERCDPDHPGKPHAVAWALARLPLRAYDAVVIVDADTVVDQAFAMALAEAAPLNDKAVQGYNGVLNPDDNAITRMAAVFADAKGRFAHRLKAWVGLNVPLRLGGCIGTAVLAEHGWNAFTIGEDWELYALLTARGVRIEQADGARVYAQEARSLRQSAPQRQRWTAGKLTVLGRLGPTLLRSRQIDVFQKLDLIAELSGPGPAVHLGGAALLCAAVLLLRPPASAALIVALGAGVLRHITYTVAALRTQPRPLRAALAFALLPLYTVWRVTVELAALRMLGDKPWIRTERHPAAPN